MDAEPDAVGLYLQRLQRFASAAEQVWSAYQQHGPGRVEAALFADVESAWQAMEQLIADDPVVASVAAAMGDRPEPWGRDLRDRAGVLCDLARQCVCRPEGLCFVTGEAGLIPRRDKIAAFEQTLQAVRDQCDRLSAATHAG